VEVIVIAELLEGKFVQAAAIQMLQLLEQEKFAQDQGDAKALARGSETEVEQGDLEYAREELQGAAGEAEVLTGGPREDPAYYPRDPIMGLLQSSLQQYWLDKTDLVVRPAGQGLAPSDVAISDVRLVPSAMDRGSQGFARAFEQTDIRWASCWLARLVRAFKHKHPFHADPALPFRISNRARVVIVGDWGTGLPRARQVGESMRDLIAAPQDRQQHVIHLGDVYYSGLKREYDDHFFPFWPVRRNEAGITSWALNSNHDMFSGAWDYYDYLLAQPQFRHQQGSSFFSLENEHWQILGLDSAYQEYDLFGLQANWVKERRQAAPKKKGMLLSHHQLFSSYDQGSPEIEKKLQPVIDAGLVTAWFWGHEHRCVAYRPRNNIRFARCVGHGGVPVWATSSSLPADVLWAETDYLSDGLERFARFGFAVLDFEDERIRVTYRGEKGQIRFEETVE
jgi:hypothetical protein